LPAGAGAFFRSLWSGTPFGFATCATSPPPSGIPCHSSAAVDRAAERTFRSLSTGKFDGAGGVALAFLVIVLDALVGPREVIAPERSSLGQEVIVSVRGVFLLNDFKGATHPKAALSGFPYRPKKSSP
jgi:hypothetical protein